MPVDEKPVAFEFPVFQFRELDISATSIPVTRALAPQAQSSRIRLMSFPSPSRVMLKALLCVMPVWAVESPPVALQRLHLSMTHRDLGASETLMDGLGRLYLAGRSLNMALMLACGTQG